MTFERPTKRDLELAAKNLNIELSEADLEYYEKVVAALVEELGHIHQLREPWVAPRGRNNSNRKSTYRPQDEHNPHNVWITKCTVKDENKEGTLTDSSIGIKDTIAMTGIEMTCGSKLLEGYVPDADATVVSRLLDAGGTILGKCNMESFGFSASSDTSDFGVVTNPNAPGRIAGGSSSGSAAAVAADEVDIALGCDQGASIRVPAACCGVVGLNPTMGLVPYTGIFPMDPTIDNVGPIANTVREVAMTLEVIAGSNELDPRQPVNLYPETYTEALVEDVSDLRIGVLQEGFEVTEHDDRVNKTVRNAISELSTLGASTTNVSLPLHHAGVRISFMIWAFGSLQMFKSGGQGTLLGGWYDTELMKVFEQYRRTRANMLPPEGKATLLAMEYLDSIAGVITYGKAQNLQYRLRDKVDQLLDGVDLLALPTMPIVPFKLDTETERNRPLQTITLCQNTAPFSLTKHPSISIPCGSIEGVPVGLMLVADRFDEQTLLRAAHTFEQRAG